MAQVIQPSFAGGEISSDVYSRVDIAKYNVALRTCLNFFVRAQGGCSNRPGTEFVAPTKYQNKRSRLIKFQFNTLQTYMLEFGDLYMRVIKDGGLVLESAQSITSISKANPGVVTKNAHGYTNGQWLYLLVSGMTQLNGKFVMVAGATANTFTLQDVYGNNINTTSYSNFTSGTMARVYELATPYTEAELPLLDFAQSADTMTITHKSHPVADLTRTGHAAWTLTNITFAPQISAVTGTTVVATVATGTGFTTQRYKITAIKNETFEESLPGLGALDTPRTITGCTIANPGVITTSGNHNFAVNDKIYMLAATMFSGGLQIAEGYYLVNSIPTATTFSIKTLAGVPVSTVGFGAYSGAGSPVVYLDGVKNNLSTAGNYNTITWSAVANALYYYVYREMNNSGVYGYLGKATGLAFTDQNITADSTSSPPEARNPFSSTDNYPGSVTYHEQRRVFGYTNTNPQTVYATQAGNYKNMNVSNPTRDDDAWTFNVASEEVNAIRYLVSQNDLVVFTSGSEFVFRPGAQGDTITPSSIAVKPESRYGSANIKPVVIGKTILFAESSQSTDAQDKGYSVRDLGYTFASDDYNGNDLTILAKHLFEFDRLTAWAYAKRPFGILWGVREDGYLTALTYLKEHEVWAWHRHNTTNGYFESVGATPEQGEDATYFVVQRTINGNVRRYIERLHTRKFRNVEDAFFVDCGLTLDNWLEDGSILFTLSGGTTWEAGESMTLTASAGYFSASANGTTIFLRTKDRGGVIGDTVKLTVTNYGGPTTLTVKPVTIVPTSLRGVAANCLAFTQTTISGLDHLEGQTVSILADGSVEEPVVVTGGAITLPNPVAKAHIGLPIIADFQTLAIAGDVSKGSLLGHPVNVGKVELVVQETRGIKIGPNADRLREEPQRQFENWSEPTRLKTGVVEAVCEGDWADGSFLVRQTDPLPITILAVIPDVQAGNS